MKKNWLQKGTEFTLVEGEFDVVNKVKPGIYNVTKDLQGWHLEKYQDRFEFPFKIYGLQTDFINYIIKTYHHTQGNLGVLMNGIKGSGKTVCAKVLANCLEIPVIIMKNWGSSNQEMIEYIGSFNFDCILFFDEFEKQFSEKDSTILQIMDGVYNSLDSRRVFLLTTNELVINKNLISRPSRIRYIKSFDDLELDAVKEYLNDNLEDKDKIEEVLAFIDTLADSTIDILKSIVTEINIHGFEEFKKARSWFNVTVNNFEYSCWSAYIEEEEVEGILNRLGISSLIPVFERDIEIKLNPILSPQKEEGWDQLDSQEKASKIRQYSEKTRRNLRGLCRTTVKSEIKFKKLKIGEEFGTTEQTIVAIDYKRNIVSTSDGLGTVCFYKVLNPDQTPSLWGARSKSITPFEYGYCNL